jgi:uncharacterized membrane protein YbhN (UPF0104 family)
MLYFVSTSLPMNLSEIGYYLRHTGILFYTSLLLFTLFLTLQAAIWVSILNDFGRQLSLRQGLLIYINSQFAKYIPGGFWNYAGRVVLASREGVRMSTQMAAIFYENILIVLAAGFYSLYLLLKLKVNPMYIIALFVVILIPLYFFSHKGTEWIGKLGRWLERKLPKLYISGPDVRLSRISWAKHLFYYLMSHLIMGISFWLLVKSFHVQSIGILYAAGTFSSAWLLGLLSPLPGGIGLREGFLAYFLSFQMDMQTALQISIIARIWNILGELLFLVIINVFDFTRKRMRLYET